MSENLSLLQSLADNFGWQWDVSIQGGLQNDLEFCIAQDAANLAQRAWSLVNIISDGQNGMTKVWKYATDGPGVVDLHARQSTSPLAVSFQDMMEMDICDTGVNERSNFDWDI
jgi:hypothetical protein